MLVPIADEYPGMIRMGGATVLETAASCVTGRGSNQLNSDLVDRPRLIWSAILCLLGMPSKRGGNISV